MEASPDLNALPLRPLTLRPRNHRGISGCLWNNGPLERSGMGSGWCLNPCVYVQMFYSSASSSPGLPAHPPAAPLRPPAPVTNARQDGSVRRQILPASLPSGGIAGRPGSSAAIKVNRQSELTGTPAENRSGQERDGDTTASQNRRRQR